MPPTFPACDNHTTAIRWFPTPTNQFTKLIDLLGGQADFIVNVSPRNYKELTLEVTLDKTLDFYTTCGVTNNGPVDNINSFHYPAASAYVVWNQAANSWQLHVVCKGSDSYYYAVAAGSCAQPLAVNGPYQMTLYYLALKD